MISCQRFDRAGVCSKIIIGSIQLSWILSQFIQGYSHYYPLYSIFQTNTCCFLLVLIFFHVKRSVSDYSLQVLSRRSSLWCVSPSNCFHTLILYNSIVHYAFYFLPYFAAGGKSIYWPVWFNSKYLKKFRISVNDKFCDCSLHFTIFKWYLIPSVFDRPLQYCFFWYVSRYFIILQLLKQWLYKVFHTSYFLI